MSITDYCNTGRSIVAFLNCKFMTQTASCYSNQRKNTNPLYYRRCFQLGIAFKPIDFCFVLITESKTKIMRIVKTIILLLGSTLYF